MFTMISNLLDDFHECFSEFLIVFILSLSIMAVGEKTSSCEWVKMRKLAVMHKFWT